MRSDWPIRQLLAVLRGVDLILGILLATIVLQLGPSLVRGGISGVHSHIVRVATDGVSQEHWGAAIARMYEALVLLVLVVAVLYWAQRFVAQRVISAGQRMPASPKCSTSGSQSKLV